MQNKIYIKILIVFLILTAIFVPFFYYFDKNYSFGFDFQKNRCLDLKCVFINKNEKEFKKGDLIAFLTNKKQSEYYKDNTIMVKRIDAVEGDNIIVQNNKIFIDNRTYIIQMYDSKFKKIQTHFFKDNDSVIVPKGCFYVAGDAKMSFDSRYWGFICKEQDIIIGKAYKIF